MAKAQAAKVFAVDEADILYNATDNFRYFNNLVKIIVDRQQHKIFHSISEKTDLMMSLSQSKEE